MKTKKLAKLTLASLAAGTISGMSAVDAHALQQTGFTALGSGAQVRTQLIDLNTTENTNPGYFGHHEKGGEHKCGEGKCGEGKCGEGKCGEGKDSGEHKCGEGKCGEAKDSGEHKCGEGKCGEGKCGEK